MRAGLLAWERECYLTNDEGRGLKAQGRALSQKAEGRSQKDEGFCFLYKTLALLASWRFNHLIICVYLRLSAAKMKA
jgi:hypothetical protein